MYTLLLTTLLACGNKEKEEDSGHIHISNDGPDGDAFSTPSCGPADGEAIRFVIGLESQEECLGTVNDDFGVVIELWENQSMESDAPVSLTSGSGLLYTGENEYTTAIDGEITVTFDGEWNSDTEYTGYYWMELEGGLIIEGGFNGSYCDIDTQCG
tara:strand:- start:4 stop:471 length:468 start_codon:yes stop_codon:yes gene_type:complete